MSGVAPFDAASAADGLVLEAMTIEWSEAAMQPCLEAEGFTEHPPPQPRPSSEDHLGDFNAEFPNIGALAENGLEVLEPVETIGDDPDAPAVGAWQDAPGYVEALVRCRDEAGDHPADQLRQQLRSSWHEVLAEVEATDEVARLRGDFTACLGGEGLPSEASVDEYHFLVHVDTLLAAASDPGRIAELSEQYGKLYVECGRGLFEARERLRGGERRSEFLAEHREDIQELTELLRSEGVL